MNSGAEIMRRAYLGLLALLVAASPAGAAVVVTVQQVNSDVSINLSGSLDLSGSSAGTGWLSGASAGIGVADKIFSIGARQAPQTLYTPLLGPSQWGTGESFLATQTSGDAIFFDGTGIYLPAAYVSGSPLSASMTLGNVDMSQLGLSGDVVFSLVSGDTLTIRGVSGAVPEPATWAMMVGGFGMIGGVMRSRRKAVFTFA
ncbi:PEPxxWA-CTERM sorting domain-containing protein [Sphingomonas sp. AP4-R1]|uniref:PEPxxWA-CTERM sorting domain-containing protein n=1 Tax=Sphingomonas sp. AP4-R1 TaxID=2735134 RepID=UPI001599E4CF|nr:PEPxxWA-CTERM sorting domain-containing protein [Sphingomonas sp. AP4-R1]QJU58544.1 PEPxxWA-CTERM sorting domain-containing protein [Sphingomonas sp. AP4-R1]